MREFGVDLHEVLQSTGLNADLFSAPDNLIAYRDLERLVSTCARLSNCNYVSLLIAQRSRLVDLGLAGRIALCGESVGDGLRRFVRHFNLLSNASTASLFTTGGYSRLVYAISEQGMTDTWHLQVGAVTVMYNVLQGLCGPEWSPAVVTFACREPSSLRPFQKYLRAPLRFDSDESALIFDSRWLGRPLPPLDPLVRQEVEAKVRAQRASLLADFPASVRRLLRKQLLIGDCSMNDVADLLGIHRRTLDRHLRRHGLRYGELVESVMADVARQLLCDTDLQVQQVAESLHFSTAANFATAFRRWTGSTPTEYRRSVGD
jgi:AraC-like DNA-binding protein